MTKANETKTASKGAAPKQSKKDQLIELLRRECGASIEEMTTATGWMPHTTRAMLTGLRKKGFGIDKQKVDGIARHSIASEPAA